MITDEAIAAAVDEAAGLLRLDGADLVLVEGNGPAARIHVQLVLEGAGCEECVLPPDLLNMTISSTMQKQLHEEFELILDDPRLDPDYVPAAHE